MVRSSTMPSPNPHDKVKNTWKRDWARNKTVYLVFVPVAIYIIVTHYLPMFGIVMAFQDFSLSKGVFGSTFVGPDNFVELFTGDAFLNAFKNTAIMAAFSLVLGFFPGLIFALMLSEVRNKTFKRTIQMISYLPNFVAAVVVTNLVKLFLGNDGPLTALLTALGLPQQNWLANANPPVFWLIHTFMGIWQSLGFGSILLMSAIANINGDIVEAAAIDGATRMQRILKITIPCIAPILGMSFVLNIAISFRTIGGNVLLLYMPQGRNMQIRKKKRIREGMVEHLTIGNHIANCIIHFCLIMVAVISLLPMWHVLMSSVSDGFSLLSYKGVAVVPVGKPTLEGYRLIFRDASVWIGYKNTIIYVAGTVGLGFVLNVLGGYALSQPTKGKGIMYGFLFVTMLFSGGIVPTYMVMNTLGLTGSRLSIILLEATQTFYLIFAAKAFAAVPLSTVEAARIDGAGHLRVMFQIMLPQAKGMFFITLLNTFVGAWNSWYNASIYVPSDKTKWPIQLFINEMTSANVNFLETATPNYSRYLIQFAVIVVATLPIMVAMPFFQDKIEAGQLQGGVKG